MSFDRRFLNVKFSVKGIVNEPPVSVLSGDQYIVGANPAGAFANASANSIAIYNGTAWKFIPASVNHFEVLNLDTSEILDWNGSAWASVVSLASSYFAPVLDVIETGATLPATATTGDKFLNTTDNKIYTATAENTWDSGTAISNNDRYVSLTSKKLYPNISIPDGTIFLCKSDKSLWSYDATADELIKFDFSSGNVAISETHTLTAAEILAKSFTLNHPIAQGTENSILLFLGGVAQVINVDFEISGNSISWNNKALQNFGLSEGDIFIINYYR